MSAARSCACSIATLHRLGSMGHRLMGCYGVGCEGFEFVGDLDAFFSEGEDIAAIDDVREHPGAFALSERARVRSCVLSLIRDPSGVPVGLLTCADGRGGVFDDAAIACARTLASMAGHRIASEAQSTMRARVARAEVETAACREAAALIERVVSCVPGVVYQFRMREDGSSCFPYSSLGMRAIYNAEPEEVAEDASGVWASLHPEDYEGVREAVLSSAKWLTPWRSRYRVVDPDGTVRWLHGEAIPERDKDGSTLWHGYIHDITNQVTREHELEDAREAELRAMRVKSEFLANVSHEIRTPLGAIMGYAEVLEQRPGGLDEQQRNAVRTIRRNGEHLLGLVNDLLDVEKVASGHMSMERIETETQRLVTDVLGTLRVRAEAKGLSLESVYQTEVPETITTDPMRARQILLNLVGNAIKFTEEGSVVVALRTLRDGERTRLVIEVTDTGIGLSEGQLERVRRFEAFTQADSSTTRRFGGTGLGLRISALLAERLGDPLEVESEEGVGSTFRVRLDPGDLEGVQMISADDTAALGHSAAGEQEHPLLGLRLLVAEDGIDNQRLLLHHLTRAGAEVEVVENGREACERVLEWGEAYDLVLMDMMMPVLDGYGATRRLREHGSCVPIIAVTAHASEEDRARCLGAGCDGYLSKPVSARSLVHACLRFVRRSDAA